MRRYGWLWLTGLLLLLGSGCRTGVTIYGDPCYELTDTEVQELLERTRQSLLHANRSVVQPKDAAALRNPELSPTYLIRYTGDKFGEAKVVWTLPEKIYTIYFEGELTGDQPRSRLTVEPRITDDDIIFFNR